MSEDRSSPPASWQQRVTTKHSRRNHAVGFASSHITVGAIRMAGMIAGLLAADRMQSPSARWSAIAGFGIATGIGEAFWRDRIERERQATEPREPD